MADTDRAPVHPMVSVMSVLMDYGAYDLRYDGQALWGSIDFVRTRAKAYWEQELAAGYITATRPSLDAMPQYCAFDFCILVKAAGLVEYTVTDLKVGKSRRKTGSDKTWRTVCDFLQDVFYHTLYGRA